MIVLFRALTYAALFIGLLLVVLPGRILEASGIIPPARLGTGQIAGLVVLVLGAALAVSCILTFAFIGKGTPAPFDPPRRLVVAGPYRWVRNPMYIGAGFTLLGAALYYGSTALALYAAGFFVLTHPVLVPDEEPPPRPVVRAA